MCVMCEVEVEILVHLFFSCSVATEVLVILCPQLVLQHFEIMAFSLSFQLLVNYIMLLHDTERELELVSMGFIAYVEILYTNDQISVQASLP